MDALAWAFQPMSPVSVLRRGTGFPAHGSWIIFEPSSLPAKPSRAGKPVPLQSHDRAAGKAAGSRPRAAAETHRPRAAKICRAEPRLTAEHLERIAADEPHSFIGLLFPPKKNARASSVNDASPGHGFSRSMAAERGAGLATLIEIVSQRARRGAQRRQSKPRNDSL